MQQTKQLRRYGRIINISSMNAFTPLINKAFKPKVFGVVKPAKN